MLEADEMLLGELRVPGLHYCPHLLWFIFLIIYIFRHAFLLGADELLDVLFKILLIELVCGNHLNAVLQRYFNLYVVKYSILHHFQLLDHLFSHADYL